MCCAHRQLCPDALLMPDAVCVCSLAQQPRSVCTQRIFRTHPLARSAMHATSASARECASSSKLAHCKSSLMGLCVFLAAGAGRAAHVCRGARHRAAAYDSRPDAVTLPEHLRAQEGGMESRNVSGLERMVVGRRAAVLRRREKSWPLHPGSLHPGDRASKTTTGSPYVCCATSQ